MPPDITLTDIGLRCPHGRSPLDCDACEDAWDPALPEYAWDEATEPTERR